MTPGNDFDEELAADTACCVIEAAKLPPLLSLELISILGVIESQAFYGVRHRPLDEPRPDVARTLEVERPRARLLDGPADPEIFAGRREHRLPSILFIEQHAESRPPRCHARCGFHRQELELGNFRSWHADAIRERFELHPMVDGKGRERPAPWPSRARPMHMVERLVLTKRMMRAAVLEEDLELGIARIFRRAQEPRHRNRAACIPPCRAGLERLLAQPAAQEPCKKRITGAEHIKNLDWKSAADDPFLDALWNILSEHDAAHRPALEHDRAALRQAPDLFQRLQCVFLAGSDMYFFFGAHDQIGIR